MITLNTVPGADGWGRSADFGEDPFETFMGWCHDHGYVLLFDDPEGAPEGYLGAAVAAYSRWQEAKR